MNGPGLPQPQGLYHPSNEHDACGVGFVANIKGKKSHGIVQQGLQILRNLTHRGAVGADPLAGDGAGILIQIPDRLFREEMARQGVHLPPVGQYGVGMAQLGIRRFNDLIGRSDLLDTKKGIEHWKARGLDFSRIFHQPKMPAEVARHNCEMQDHGLAKALDNRLIDKCLPAFERGEKVQFMTCGSACSC